MTSHTIMDIHTRIRTVTPTHIRTGTTTITGLATRSPLADTDSAMGMDIRTATTGTGTIKCLGSVRVANAREGP
ncbi:MAG: hypothetical protein WDN28_03095 [Chthoniobacter sp.]